LIVPKPKPVDPFVAEVEQTLEWFCNKIVEPVPIHPEDREEMFRRMMQLGWLRNSEYETYKELTKPDDD
jgi:hypothetical protein